MNRLVTFAGPFLLEGVVALWVSLFQAAEPAGNYRVENILQPCRPPAW